MATTVACCCLLLVALPAQAQRIPAPLPASRAPAGAGAGVHADSAISDREISPIVLADAAPRSFRVVSIAIPPGLGRAGAVRYQVLSTGGATILGSKSGLLEGPSPSAGVVLTVGVPATAIGGRARVGVVRFAAVGETAVLVPIELDVAGISHIEVTPSRPMRGARRGDRMELSFSIRNSGNVRETLALTIEAPASWSTRWTEPPRVALEPGESVERSIIVNVPTTSDLGDFGIAVVAATASGTRARGVTAVEITDGLRAGADAGPLVTLGVGSAAANGGSARAVESVALQGPLGDALTVAGRITAPLPSDLVASRALTMLGYSSRSSFLSLSAADWSATLGNTGAALPDLGGQSVFGRGGAVRVGGERGDLRLLAATPSLGGALAWDQSSLIGASVDARVGANTVTAFLAHLRDSSYTVRALDAAGVGVEMRPWTDGVVSGQLAARSYRGGNGLGVASVVRSPLAGGQLDVQLTHAPGGTGAFALATDAFTVAGDRAFGRLQTQASYWATRDDGTPSDDLVSTGWSLMPTYPILPALTVASYVEGSTFTSSGSEGRFASTQRDVGARAVLLHAGFELSADSRLGTISRAIDGGTRIVVNDDSRRVTNRVRLDHAGARGEIGIGGSTEATLVGAAAMPSQSTLDAHVDRLQVFPPIPHLTVSGSAQWLRFGDATLTTSRLEADLDLRGSTRIAVGVERGTARDAAGVLQTVLTLKLERSARLPALGRRSASGVVFEDRNGNGVRDPGEQGVSGIVVRRGSQSAVTGSDGVFRLDRAASGRTDIDPRSLPSGWLPSARSLGAGDDEQSLGVVPTTALDVDVRLAGAPDGSVSMVRIGRAALTLRDTAGRVWAARTDEMSHATFDALPVGRYTLLAELDESSEPLVVDGTPAIEITGAARRQHVTITARTRPLRMFRGQP